jgi:predicted GNAT superfamily acetyltransferase
MFQRDWAAGRGIAGITWTFDPLVRRNAVFNFEKLQATAVEYLPNFYGSMTDSINAGDESDRLFVYWPTAAASSDPSSPSSDAIWVELPADVEALRRTDLPATLQWRKTVREALQPKLDSGWVIRRMNPERTAVLIEPPANRN